MWTVVSGAGVLFLAGMSEIEMHARVYTARARAQCSRPA
jgi:hypothetical protein